MRHTTTWAIALTGAFILALSLADLAATKLITIGNVVAPGGIFLFSIIFVVRDMLHRLLGAEYVKRTILIAAALNVFMAAYFFWITTFPAPAFFALAEPWNAIFAFAPGIAIGSIIAAVVSQWVNTIVYEAMWRRDVPLWGRVIASNAVSLPIDSILFTVLAFVAIPPLFGGTPMDLGTVIARVASGQIIIKAIVMLIMTPLVYLVPAAAHPSRRTA